MAKSELHPRCRRCAFELAELGVAKKQIARDLGVVPGTIRNWLAGQMPPGHDIPTPSDAAPEPAPLGDVLKQAEAVAADAIERGPSLPHWRSQEETDAEVMPPERRSQIRRVVVSKLVARLGLLPDQCDVTELARLSDAIAKWIQPFAGVPVADEDDALTEEHDRVDGLIDAVRTEA